MTVTVTLLELIFLPVSALNTIQLNWITGCWGWAPPSFLLPSIMWYTNSHLHQITLLDQSFLLTLQPSDAIISCFLSTFQLMHLGSVFLQFVTHTTIMCFPVAGLIATSTNSFKMLYRDSWTLSYIQATLNG